MSGHRLKSFSRILGSCPPPGGLIRFLCGVLLWHSGNSPVHFAFIVHWLVVCSHLYPLCVQWLPLSRRSWNCRILPFVWCGIVFPWHECERERQWHDTIHNHEVTVAVAINNEFLVKTILLCCTWKCPPRIKFTRRLRCCWYSIIQAQFPFLGKIACPGTN